MKPHVLAAALPTDRKSELMDVGAKVAEAVQVSRGVGHHGEIRRVKPGPRRFAGLELEPGGTEPKVIGYSASLGPVDAASHALQATVLKEASQRAGRDPGIECLLASHEPHCSSAMGKRRGAGLAMLRSVPNTAYFAVEPPEQVPQVQ